MIPHLTKGAGIKGAALYVLHDERSLEDRALGADLSPEQQFATRVGMTATRNLSTDDPELAWRLMCATAMAQKELKRAAGVSLAGAPTKQFCGHLSLSWEHETQPDKAEMLRAADGALKAMGWDKLQALIVEHKDHEHAHCHIVVNLIDPDTGRAAPNVKDDYERILQPWAHDYDKARGLNVCPERTKKMEAKERGEQHRPQRAHTRAEWESGRQAANDDRPTPRTRAEKVDAYRAAVAQAREAMRPEWGAHYKQARADAAKLAKDHAAEWREFQRAAGLQPHHAPSPHKGEAARALDPKRTELLAFYNRHRETIWRGLEGEKVTTSAALLSPAVIHRALEKAQAQEQRALTAATDARKAALVERMEAARQQVQRDIFRQHDRADLRTHAKDAESAARARIEARQQQKAQARAKAAPQRQAERGLKDYAARRQHAAAGMRASPAQRAAEAQERAQGVRQASRPQEAPEPPKAAQTTPQPQQERVGPAAPAFTFIVKKPEPEQVRPDQRATPEKPAPANAPARDDSADRQPDRADDRQQSGASASGGGAGSSAPKPATQDPRAEELAKAREAIRARMHATRENRVRERERDRDRER